MLYVMHPLGHRDVQEIPFLEAYPLLHHSPVAIYGDVA